MSDKTRTENDQLARELAQEADEIEAGRSEDIQVILRRVGELREELDEADSIIQQTQARKSEIQAEVSDLLEKADRVIDRFKSQLEGLPRTPKPTAQQLILDFLRQKKRARAKDIKTYLESLGQDGNPVVLSKLRDDGLIKSVERGMYALAGSAK